MGDVEDPAAILSTHCHPACDKSPLLTGAYPCSTTVIVVLPPPASENVTTCWPSSKISRHKPIGLRICEVEHVRDV